MLKRHTKRAKSRLQAVREAVGLGRKGRAAVRRDRRGLPEVDPGPEAIVREGLRWLLLAQRESTGRDGGVARHYGLGKGWSPSYPETTGYIVPTFLGDTGAAMDPTLHDAASRMLDFLVAEQFPEGAIAGGMVGQVPRAPVTFNTGQVLLGFASGAGWRPDRYREPMDRAAEWLVKTQDADGAWRSHPSPFAAKGDKVIDTHVAWGLLEAARVGGNERFAESGRRNIQWALTRQTPNGWFRDARMGKSENPLTHAIGYVLRGLIEGFRYFRDDAMLRSAVLTADALSNCLGPDGFLAGRLDDEWRPGARWACLTGTSQIALCWLLLYGETGDERHLRSARLANAYVRRTVRMDGPPELRGGVQGSFPCWGEYGRFQLPNWACKFTVDASLLEMELDGSKPHASIAR